jgi:hypothetical protein
MVLHTQLTLAKNSDNKQHLALVLWLCCLDVRDSGFVTGKMDYFCGILGKSVNRVEGFPSVKLENRFKIVLPLPTASLTFV